MNLWKYQTHARTDKKKALRNAGIECNMKIVFRHRNEKDNWITITSNLQFAFLENKHGLLLFFHKEAKWQFHICGGTILTYRHSSSHNMSNFFNIILHSEV